MLNKIEPQIKKRARSDLDLEIHSTRVPNIIPNKDV